MSRDRLLPGALARTHPRFRTPHRLTYVVGAVVIVLTGLVPLSTLAELVNIGTLLPSCWWPPACSTCAARSPIASARSARRWCPRADPLDRRVDLPDGQPRGATWLRFAVWMALGLVVYFLYSRSRSVLARREGAAG